MAVINEKYFSEEYEYSDGTIEDVILEMVKQGKSLFEIKKEEYDYAVLYHLSQERENILNWYPFDKNASLLEIGAGCGAITGMLASKVQRVVATDISKKRTLINYYRNEQRENIEYYIGNFNDMQFGEKFDYIVLNGVFEYAMSFTATEAPYEDFLKYVLTFLKENGRILIAIENRLGLKYFSGAPEDHTGTLFLGLNDYEGNNSVRTFSKSEWTTILESVGIENYRFYYPYPDYKFPNEIFTEEFCQGYGKDYYNFLDNCAAIFNERAVAGSLVRENLVGKFSNSFLIELSPKPLEELGKVIYAKINSQRDEKYQIITTIREEHGERRVFKNFLREEAKDHILSIQKNEEIFKNENVSCLKAQDTPEGLMYPYLSEGSLNDEFRKDIKKRSKEKIVDYLRKVFEAILCENIGVTDYKTERFQQVFGNVPEKYRALVCVRPANVDSILDNIYRKEGKYIFIDNEWIFDFPVPKDFIVWRCINEIYVQHEEIHKVFQNYALFRSFDLSAELCQVFEKWNQHFTLKYVKANGLERFAKPRKNIFVDQILIKMVSCLYFDFGEGFQEEHMQAQECMPKDHYFKQTFELPNPDSIKNLRWDPVDSRLCRCMVKASGEYGEVDIVPVNATLMTEQGEMFLHTDPQYIIRDISKIGRQLVVEGTITFLESKELAEAIRLYEHAETSKQRYLMQLEREVVEMSERVERAKQTAEETVRAITEERDYYCNTLQAVYATKGWRVLQKIRKIVGR